jgi:hypothetical protein
MSLFSPSNASKFITHTPLPLKRIDQELIDRKGGGVRQVWVGAGLKERTKGSGLKEEGNLCWLLGFSIMGLGFFFWTVRKKEISVWKMEWVEVMFLFLLFFF